MEESNDTNIYENFKFVTREELVNLGLTKLIGTTQLKAYMHGYFMNLKLYNEVINSLFKDRITIV